MAYLTLTDIVNGLLIEEGKTSAHEFMRYMDIANRGLKQMMYDVSGGSKVTLLTVSSTLRVDLPADFVDYTFIGMVSTNGSVRPLGMKKDIPLVGTANVKSNIISGLSEVPIYNETLFGLGGGQNKNGYYSPSIDRDNWQMVMTSMEAGKVIYMEYVSDGSLEHGQQIVHPYIEEALIAWIYWKTIQKKRGISMSEKEVARREYFNEKRLANSRMKGFTKEEALGQARKGFKQSPKM